MLLALSEPPERRAVRLAWSAFRRRHQAGAKQSHCRRRARADPPHADPRPIARLSEPLAELTDAVWARIAALLPPPAMAGRPPADHRRLLAGMLWVMRTGATWREVPAEFGPWHAVYQRYQEWRHAGIWTAIVALLTPEASVNAADLSL